MSLIPFPAPRPPLCRVNPLRHRSLAKQTFLPIFLTEWLLMVAAWYLRLSSKSPLPPTFISSPTLLSLPVQIDCSLYSSSMYQVSCQCSTQVRTYNLLVLLSRTAGMSTLNFFPVELIFYPSVLCFSSSHFPPFFFCLFPSTFSAASS